MIQIRSPKSVPDQLYEAAEIDGANWWQRIWYVTCR
jgi:multiple sugar transport system permease protein